MSVAPPPAWPFHLAAALWTSLVCLLLALPGGTLGAFESELPFGLPPGSDKVVHALLFAVETACLAASFRRLGRSSRPLDGAMAAAALLAVATEGGQRWVPGRHASAADVVADLLGVAVCAVWFRHRSRTRGRGGVQGAGETR